MYCWLGQYAGKHKCMTCVLPQFWPRPKQQMAGSSQDTSTRRCLKQWAFTCSSRPLSKVSPLLKVICCPHLPEGHRRALKCQAALWKKVAKISAIDYWIMATFETTEVATWCWIYLVWYIHYFTCQSQHKHFIYPFQTHFMCSYLTNVNSFVAKKFLEFAGRSIKLREFSYRGTI